MNNIIKILIVAVASAWAMPMPAAPADKNKDNDPTWMANHAKGDTAKTDANAVAPLPDDTLPKEKVVPVDDAGSEAEADTSTAATDEEQGEDKAEKKETASALWYLALIWLIVLTAGMAYVFYTVYKRLENHSKALHKFKDDQARVAASVNGGSSALDARLKDMEGTLASLRTENDRLKTKVSSLESAVKDLTAGGRTVSGTHNTGRQGTGPQLRKATDSDEETYYVDTLNIGGDGIVLIENSEIADAKMRIFNLDGSEGKMAGNCIRCVGKYLYDNMLVESDRMTIETASGVRTLKVFTRNGKVSSATVEMGKAELKPQNIPVNLDGDRIIDRKITLGGDEYAINCVSVGNPHCAVFVDNVDKVDIQTTGPLFENNPLFPERINTEFVRVINKNMIKMRVWERGNGETMACGTGACAAVVAAVENGYCAKGEDITVKVRGGDLVVNYTDEAITLTGDANLVYKGEIEY